MSRRSLVLAVIAASSFALLYGQILARLVYDWGNDDNYSHGFLVIPIALYLVWRRRHSLAQLPMNPRGVGLVIVVAGLAMLVVGVLGAEFFLARTSMLVVLAGSVVFVRGWRAFRLLAFPIAFLALMIPIPAIIFNQVAFPLQLLASHVGETALTAWGVPVLREGNVIILSNTSLQVAEACSGIRSLVSLLTLGIVYGYFVDARTSVRTAIAASTVPIAIVANGFRVAGTGIAAHYLGPQVAEGFFHTFSGWIVFTLAFLLVFALAHLIVRFMPTRPAAGPEPVRAV